MVRLKPFKIVNINVAKLLRRRVKRSRPVKPEVTVSQNSETNDVGHKGAGIDDTRTSNDKSSVGRKRSNIRPRITVSNPKRSSSSSLMYTPLAYPVYIPPMVTTTNPSVQVNFDYFQNKNYDRYDFINRVVGGSAPKEIVDDVAQGIYRETFPTDPEARGYQQAMQIIFWGIRNHIHEDVYNCLKPLTKFKEIQAKCNPAGFIAIIEEIARAKAGMNLARLIDAQKRLFQLSQKSGQSSKDFIEEFRKAREALIQMDPYRTPGSMLDATLEERECLILVYALDPVKNARLRKKVEEAWENIHEPNAERVEGASLPEKYRKIASLVDEITRLSDESKTTVEAKLALGATQRMNETSGPPDKSLRDMRQAGKGRRKFRGGGKKKNTEEVQCEFCRRNGFPAHGHTKNSCNAWKAANAARANSGQNESSQKRGNKNKRQKMNNERNNETGYHATLNAEEQRVTEATRAALRYSN